MTDLSTPIEKLARVGPRMAPRLKKLGIYTIGDLLHHFPTRYEDYRSLTDIGDIQSPGDAVAIRGVISDIRSAVSWRSRRLAITTATIEDETGSFRIVWFNQPYIERALPVGTPVNLAGKVVIDKKGFYISNPSYEKSANDVDELKHTGRLVPKYAETEGITSKYLRFLIKPILDDIFSVPDPLPESILETYDFPRYVDALYGMHFPEKEAEVEPARRRFAFEELLMFQIRALQDRQHLQQMPAPKITFDKELVAQFVHGLPFPLTNDQRVATFEIVNDLDRAYPMNRLLNGDVGSGKTVVALIAAYEVMKAGYQAVLMAPTEILARQHFATATMLMAGHDDVRIGLLTGSEARQWPNDEVTEEKISKKLMSEKIANAEVRLVIGTHAVIQKTVAFKNLGLVIIDEQHRFGVEQRMKLLKDRQQAKKLVPHLLSMTATPIPRTLALTIYGDLDVSLIKEKPKGRQTIITKTVSMDKRPSAYGFIEEEVGRGRQVFVICPRIEISKAEETKDGSVKQLSIAKELWAEVKAVTEEYERLSKEIFPHRRVVMLHGKMKPKEKADIMADFRDGKYDILVATSVIEVGVDVPNATIMMIESAERFGLAQLHQFRGRVGRGAHQSYCFLFTSGDVQAGRRLKSLEKIESGFELAEIDMKIRGPGEFTGVKQSGMPDLAMASLSDIELIKQARHEAKQLLQIDPTLERHPLIRERVNQMQKVVHFE